MYINRSNQAVIYSSFSSPYVTALLGQRRVGKSTLVAQYAEQYSQNPWVFLNMDSREERQRVENNQLKAMIEESAQQRISNNSKIWVAIGEAQKCPALFEQIKLLYDQYKDQSAIKFIITGSGFLSLHQLSAESLAGRIELFYLRDFNLKETTLVQYAKPLPDDSFFDLISSSQEKSLVARITEHVESYAYLRNIIQEKLSEQIVWGGLPEVLQESDLKQRLNYLSNYLQTYLEKDIRDITTITDLNLYQRLMEIIAEQTGSIRQDKEVLEALGCSRDTLKKYRGYLSSTMVYKEIFPFIGRTLKRITKAPKAYLLNNGLISYLTGIEDKNILEKTGLIGHRFENWFLKELQIWLDRTVKHSDIYYWRTSSGVEVDFVVEVKPSVFPFEITYSRIPKEQKVKNLIHFMEDEKNAKFGFYIYVGDFKFDAERKIFFIPAWAVC